MDQHTTGAAPVLPALARARESALARLAFGGGDQGSGSVTWSRHLAFVPVESLQLDLDDPAQRAFGEYELLEQIGQGGMGIVYRAHQHSLARQVALKLLSAGPWASADFIGRFKREAQSAARMQHPNIVPIYEVGQHEELNYFTMRLVQGPSLAQRLREQGAMPGKDAARLLRTIAEAVDYAHRLGVLHLDLKPGNVLIDERGEAQVADFGLARRLDETLAADNDEVSGTPSYMAPEQAQVKSRRLTPATDIWGLGAILYECLTGRPPFVGVNAQDTLARVVRDEIEPPGALVPGLSPDLEAVCLKCLRKDPAERYASARALADDLGRFLEDREVGVRPLGRAQRVLRWARREPKLAFAVGAAALALFAGIAATSLQWRRAESNAAGARASAESAEQSAMRARETAWRARRDQAWRAAAIDWQFYSALAPLAANLREEVATGATAQAELDRVFLASILNTQPALVDVIAVGRRISSVALAPDGRSVAVASDDGVVREYDTADGAERWHTQAWHPSEIRADAAEVYQPVSPDEMIRAHAAAIPGELHYSPDGRFLVADTVGLHTRSPHGVKMRRIALERRAADPYPEGYVDAAYSADGTHAVFRDDAGGARSYALDPERPLSPRVALEARDWILSRDGSVLVVAPLRGARIEIRDGRSLALRHAVALGRLGALSTIALSPDGTRLAYTLKSVGGALIDTASGRELTRLQTYGIGTLLAFSADGAWLMTHDHILDARTGATLTSITHIHHKTITGLGGIVNRTGGWVLIAQHTQFLAIGRHMRSPGLWGDHLSVAARLAARQELGTSAFDFHEPSLLVATGDIGGELRLWRLRAAPAAGLAAPPQAFEQFAFDGAHLPDVRGDAVVVREVAGARAVSGPMRHGEPVRYAQLAADGRTLVSVAGRSVHVWNWREGAARFAPIELDAVPVRLTVSEDARRLAVSCANWRGDELVERVQVYGLDDGRASRGAWELEGPLGGIRLSHDGDTLLAFRGGALSVLDLDTASPARTPALGTSTDGNARVARAEFSGDGRSIVAQLDSSAPPSQLIWLDAKSGARRTERAVGLRGAAMAVDRAATLVALQHPDFATLRVEHWSLGDEAVRSFESQALLPSLALAFAPNDRWVAHGGMRGTVLLDRDALPLSPPLLTGKLQHDEIPRRAAFGADGLRLAAQSTLAEYGYWDFSTPIAAVEEFERLAELYVADPKLASRAADEGVRRLLRSLDPGPPTPEQRTATEQDELPPWSVPARDPRAGARQLDLGALYNTPMTERYNDYYPFTDFRAVPLGLVRLDGVDFDLRGAVQLLRHGERLGTLAFPTRAGPIATPERVARVHALALQFKNFANEKPSGHVAFEYRDGSSARATLVEGRDVLPLYEQGERLSPPLAVPIAWVGRNTNSERSTGGDVRLYHATLDNPYPERALRALSLEASDEPDSAPMFFALTVDEAAQSGQERRR